MMKKPKPKLVQYTDSFYECYDKSHRHKKRIHAERCIDRKFDGKGLKPKVTMKEMKENRLKRISLMANMKSGGMPTKKIAESFGISIGRVTELIRAGRRIERQKSVGKLEE